MVIPLTLSLVGRNHRKALAGLAGARRLDRGVERQQVRLAGDVGDEAHDVADPARGIAQLLHEAGRVAGLDHRAPGEFGRPVDLAADLLHRGAEFLGGCRYGADIRGRLLGRRRHGRRLAGGLGGGGMLCGTAVALRALKPAIRIYGVEPEASSAVKQAVDAGSIVNINPNSVADGLGAPYAGSWTLPLAATLLDGIVTLPDFLRDVFRV